MVDIENHKVIQQQDYSPARNTEGMETFGVGVALGSSSIFST